jgi:hypothetical protein
MLCVRCLSVRHVTMHHKSNVALANTHPNSTVTTVANVSGALVERCVRCLARFPNAENYTFPTPRRTVPIVLSLHFLTSHRRLHSRLPL